MEVTGTSTGGKGKPEKVRKITKGQVGDPRFLAIAIDCVKQRREILGLDAPKESRVTGAGDSGIMAPAFDTFLQALIQGMEHIPGGKQAIADALECLSNLNSLTPGVN